MTKEEIELRRLIAFAYRLGQLSEKKSLLGYLSLVSVSLPDNEPASIKTRFILQQMGKKVLPSLMSQYQGIFGDGANAIEQTITLIIDYPDQPSEISDLFVQEMASKQNSLRRFLDKIPQIYNKIFILEDK